MRNLALCCGRCNAFKGPNLAGVDPDIGRTHEHFRYEAATLIGLTPVDRATVRTLSIKLPLRVAARRALLETGVSL